MADEPARPHPHFYLPGSGKPLGYTAHAGGGGGTAAPQRDRAAHSQQLTQALTQVVVAGETLLANRDPQVASGTPGFYIEFTLPADQAVTARSRFSRTRRLTARALRRGRRRASRMCSTACPRLI